MIDNMTVTSEPAWSRRNNPTNRTHDSKQDAWFVLMRTSVDALVRNHKRSFDFDVKTADQHATLGLGATALSLYQLRGRIVADL